MVNLRHGALTDTEKVTSGIGITGVAMVSSDDRAKGDAAFSMDMLTYLPVGKRAVITAYVEGATTPDENGVFALDPGSNGDAATAADRDGKGRFQLSEFHYWRSFGQGGYSVGLIDPAGFLDLADLANDETGQFLSSGLINNGSIDFPDYTLGVGFHSDALGDEESGLTLVAASSHGLGDNPDASYAQLANLGTEGKGAFLAAEMYWLGLGRLSGLRIGAWTNTADHPELDAPEKTRANMGLYAVADLAMGDTLVNGRIGAADPKVSKTAAFLSMAAERPAPGLDAALGLGVAWHLLSSTGKGKEEGDMVQAEAYLRFEPIDTLSLTPCLQWHHNPEFDGSGDTVDADLFNLGFRVSGAF